MNDELNNSVESSADDNKQSEATLNGVEIGTAEAPASKKGLLAGIIAGVLVCHLNSFTGKYGASVSISNLFKSTIFKLSLRFCALGYVTFPQNQIHKFGILF